VWDILSETRSAKLHSDLGIGPKFHGVYEDARGRAAMVMDIVPGDFEGGPVNDLTMADYETMRSRMAAAHLYDPDDFQFYRTQLGRLLVIDPSQHAARIGLQPLHPSDSALGRATADRFRLLETADPGTRIRYLRELERTNAEAFIGLARLSVTRWQRLPAVASQVADW
jgi:hypothetical protein